MSQLKLLLSAVALLLLSSSLLVRHGGTEAKVFRSLITEVFHSAPIVLSPGSVSNKFYYNIPFPRGHIAIKSFDAEVADENDAPVPLSETYLHHWIVLRYFVQRTNRSNGVIRENDGICDNGSLSQYFGLGSETLLNSSD